MDCAAQSMDPRFAQQSMDCPLNPWIVQTKDSKYGSGQTMDRRSKPSIMKHETLQTPGDHSTVCSQPKQALQSRVHAAADRWLVLYD